MHVIVYSKHFTSGILAGLTVADEAITYSTAADAERTFSVLSFAEHSESEIEAVGGSSDYTVSNVELVEVH